MSDGAFEDEEAAVPDADAKQSSPLWVDELPFISMLVLALGGAAYACLSPGPSLTFWQILAPVFAVFCIVQVGDVRRASPPAGVSSGRRRCIGALFCWRCVCCSCPG